MIFLFINLIISQQVFNITSESIRSLELYFTPRDMFEIEVNDKLQTYFSDISKSNGLSIEIETNDSSLFGPYTYLSHLDGIDFGDEFSYYKISLMNEGDYNTRLAIIFTEDLETALKMINQNFPHYDFLITDFPSKDFKFFYSGGLLFHGKKYSKSYFVAVPTVLIILFISINVLGIPKVMSFVMAKIKKLFKKLKC